MRGQSGISPPDEPRLPQPFIDNAWSPIIMSFLGRQSAATDMANFKFSRRELPGKLLAIGAALLLPERRSEVLLAPTKVQPKFKIGDLVAEDWLDEYDATATDFGQVLGMAYFQEAQQQYFEANSWVYYVNWTSSTSEAGFAYPTYDQEPSRESDLRLVSAEEICKH